MGRDWILGCYRVGGTTECSGPALFNGQRLVVHEVTSDSIVITRTDLRDAIKKAQHPAKNVIYANVIEAELFDGPVARTAKGQDE